MSAVESLKMKAEQTKAKAVVVFRDMKTKANESKDRAVVLANESKDRAVVLVRDPQFQTCTIVTTGGAITFGALGGTFGLASGVVLGSAAGVLPALFTFGLSIPAGAAVGGVTGLCAGTLVGGASGGVGGLVTYKYRVEIKDGVMVVKVKTQETLNTTKDKGVMAWTATTAKISTQVRKIQTSVTDLASKAKTTSIVAVSDLASKAKETSTVAVDFTKGKASEALNFATTTKVGVTSSSAVAGAVVGGTTVGAVGTVAGAVVGIVPALFTFGLSIPAGAVIGLCIGTTVGGSAGAVGGGAVGYGGFTHRKAISEGVQSSWGKVSSKADQLKSAALACAGDAKESLRPRTHSTGGSDVK